MPFKSQASRRKFAQLLVEGKITNETFEEMESRDRHQETARARRGDQEDVKKKRVTKEAAGAEEAMTCSASCAQLSDPMTDGSIRIADGNRGDCDHDP